MSANLLDEGCIRRRRHKGSGVIPVISDDNPAAAQHELSRPASK
jgi:hypothetical protein